MKLVNGLEKSKNLIKIAPSILSADKDKLQQEVSEIEPYCELLHVDIMDGKFVPPTTFTAEDIKKIKTSVEKDVHLMVDHPIKDGFIEDYADAGADIITIHEECKDDIKEAISLIKSKGIKAAISINPPTPIKKIKPYLDDIDMVLVMSVNPGYAGQKFIPEVLLKIKELKALRPELEIEIDGGIGPDTINEAYKAGANIFVAGSAIFGKSDKVAAIKNLQKCANN
ncbi:MAG: ribulose-phosphate 3-epimerase [Nanoarchaeota archaeon]